MQRVVASGLVSWDLSGADLQFRNLSGRDFRDYNFRGANLSGVDFTGAHLEGANFSEADLTLATLDGAYLRGANLSWARLTGAYLYRADLTDANIDCMEIDYGPREDDVCELIDCVKVVRPQERVKVGVRG